MNWIKMLCLATWAIAANADPTPPRQSDASYEAAFNNQSTSPSYVLITVINGNTGSSQSVCTLANFVLGAIHFDSHVGYGPEGSKRVIQVALMNRAHVFEFTDEKALKNVSRRYTDEVLTEVRTALQEKSVQQILGAAFNDPALGKLKGEPGGLGGLQDAIACVLLERGESPRMADLTGQLLVEH